MRSKFNFTAVILILFFTSCRKEKPLNEIIDNSLALAAKQYTSMAEVMKDKPGLLPRTIDTTGTLVTSNSGWWTSGFFPGSLWYLCEYTKDKKFRDYAT
jgi:hypothetical protein